MFAKCFFAVVAAGGVSLALPINGLSAWAQDARERIDGVQMLERGPVHEAFAEPVGLHLVPPSLIPGQPPAIIDESLPAFRPSASTAVWIGGYWDWDEGLGEFVWVSGTWRVPPDEQRWIPGYWLSTPAGSRRVAGFWTSEKKDRLSYLPFPPQSAETGPKGPAPSPDHFWSPGFWDEGQAGYRWRSGYWSLQRDGRTWVAPHYAWTPQGAVFTGGYWDLPLERRGMLFAPLRLVGKGGQHKVAVTPSELIDLSTVEERLFFGPGRRHYYFGDYYDARFERIGFEPWYVVGDGKYSFDPVYNYRSWRLGRDNPAWHQRYQRQFVELAQRSAWGRRYAGEERRGPMLGGPGPVESNVRISQSLDRAVNDSAVASRFARVSELQLGQLQHTMDQARQWSVQRAERETGGAQNAQATLPAVQSATQSAGALPASPYLGFQSVSVVGGGVQPAIRAGLMGGANSMPGSAAYIDANNYIRNAEGAIVGTSPNATTGVVDPRGGMAAFNQNGSVVNGVFVPNNALAPPDIGARNLIIGPNVAPNAFNQGATAIAIPNGDGSAAGIPIENNGLTADRGALAPNDTGNRLPSARPGAVTAQPSLSGTYPQTPNASIFNNVQGGRIAPRTPGAPVNGQSMFPNSVNNAGAGASGANPNQPAAAFSPNMGVSPAQTGGRNQFNAQPSNASAQPGPIPQANRALPVPNAGTSGPASNPAGTQPAPVAPPSAQPGTPN